MIQDERNQLFFGHTYSKLPNCVILCNVETKINTMLDMTTASKKRQQITNNVEDIKVIVLPWRHELIAANTETPHDSTNDEE